MTDDWWFGNVVATKEGKAPIPVARVTQDKGDRHVCTMEQRVGCAVGSNAVCGLSRWSI